MNELALFAGGGMLSVGLRIAVPYLRTVCYVERESYAAATLVARMADAALDTAPIWDDVATFDGRPWRGLVDIISAGYPCQPFSHAGKGLASKDERYMWPHVARIIDEVGPELVFLENVEGHLNRGFSAVRAELQQMGYRVEAGLFSAAETGANHQRCRLFALAHREGPRNGSLSEEEPRRKTDASGGGHTMGNTPRGNVSKFHPVALAALPEYTRSANASALPLYAYGPNDPRWANVSADLKPTVCRLADGVAAGVERQQLSGNGVCPMVAALAFATLYSRFDFEGGLNIG